MYIKIKEISLVILLSVVTAVLFNSISAKSVDYIFKHPVIKNKSIISLYEAKKIFDEKRALFIDARPEAQYKRDHIPSAINIPYNSNKKEELTSEISKDKNIIVYCFSKRCNQARRLSDALIKIGFKQVALFEEGIIAWQKAKYPVEKNKN